jgi:tetratricopeptide (TPR) repeat protein
MTLKTLAAAAVLTWTFSAPARASDRAAAAGMLSQAQESYRRGLFKDAQRAVGEALKADSRSAAAYELQARLWHVFGDAVQQKRDAERALSLLGGGKLAPDALIEQGGAYLLDGQTAKALASLDAAVTATNGSPEALAARARARRESGDLANARADLDAALKSGKKVPLWLYSRARVRYETGDDAGAIADLADALRANKEFPIAYGLLGAALAHQGDFKRAGKAYDKALSLDAGYAFAYLGRAALKLRQGDEPGAMKDFENAVRADPQDYAPYFNRAEAHWRAGRREQALADDRNALASPSVTAAAALAIGEHYLDSGLGKDAVEAFTRAKSLGLVARALRRRAQAWGQLEKPKNALADLDESLKAEPDVPGALVERGGLEARFGMEKEALEDYTRAVSLAPTNADALVARARFYAARAKPELAEADYNSAIDADPADAEAYSGRASVLAGLGQDEKAIADAAKAVDLRPDDPQARLVYGELLIKARQYSRAVEAFTAALTVKAPPARALVGRATAKARLGDMTGAKNDAEDALEKDSKNARVYDALGAMRLRARDYEQAVRDLNQALSLEPDDAAALVLRGLAYGSLGRSAPSLDDLRRATELAPRSKEAWTALCQAERVSGNLKESAHACEQALAIDSQHGSAYLQMALTQLELKQYPRVIEDADSAWQLGVRRAQGMIAKATAQVALKQYREAHESYLRAVDLDPGASTAYLGFMPGHPAGADFLSSVMSFDDVLMKDQRDPYTYIVRADALHSGGQYDKAVLEYTKAMEIDGNVADAYVGRGVALTSQDSLEAAQQDFIRAVELAPGLAGPRVRLAVVLTMRRSYSAALTELGKALKIEPKSAELHLRAGNAHYFLKEYEMALENYRLAVEEDPLDARAQNGLGLGELGLGHRAEAIEAFSRAADLDPLSDRAYRNRATVWNAMQKYGNAASDYRTGSLVNTDPELVDEYRKLIEQAQSRAAGGKSS